VKRIQHPGRTPGYNPVMEPSPSNSANSDNSTSRQLRQWLENGHKLWLVAAFIYAIGHLLILRNGDPRAVFLFLVPPILAFGILSSPKPSRPMRFAAQLFLGLVAVAIILGEQPLILQNMRPLFPGVPREQDRVLTFYLGAYSLFIMGFLPGYVFIVSLYRHSRGEAASLTKPTCYLGLATWLLLLTGLIAGIPHVMKAMF
jgi:hypothetical protein